MKSISTALLLLASALCTAAEPDPLVRDFREPPRPYGLRCYWYWQNGEISKEGITQDMEAMKRVGIIEPYIGIIEGGGPVKALTPEWWDLLAYAVREATRLDMDIGIFNCPGWSQSGGPWIKPEQSMRYLHVEELRVTEDILATRACQLGGKAFLALEKSNPELILANIQDGDVAWFRGLDFSAGAATLVLKVRGGVAGDVVELRENDAAGALLGTVTLDTPAAPDSRRICSTRVPVPARVKDICFVFKTQSPAPLPLASFRWE